MYSFSKRWSQEADIIAGVLRKAPAIDTTVRIDSAEFHERQDKVIRTMADAGIDAAIVYSDEHYNGDVPYLGGCTNISIEPIAGVIGKNGFHILAGLEGGYIAEQLGYRSGSKIHKVAMLKLADEEYPIEAEDIEDILEEAAGKKPQVIGLLTPRAVLPVGIYEFLKGYVGTTGQIVDAQELYQQIKYEKSENELKLLREASLIADLMAEGMLRVLKPGMTETQVAQWAYVIALEMGIEEMGFNVMVNANEANRTLIGKALNRKINEFDWVHVGVSPKRDGLTACVRSSVIAVDDPGKVSADQCFWLDFIRNAFQVGLNAYIDVARNSRPAYLQEKALMAYFESRSDEVGRRIGKPIDLVRQKPYTGTHNGGYTECQEFYGAITLNSKEPLGYRIETMLDVAVRGIGNKWDDIVIPGLDYVVIERTLAKTGPNVEVMTQLPQDVQHLVGCAV